MKKYNFSDNVVTMLHSILIIPQQQGNDSIPALSKHHSISPSPSYGVKFGIIFLLHVATSV